MEIQEVKKLLEKYYEGFTSMEEEARLSAYFKQENIPDHLIAEKEMFLFYATEKGEEYPADLSDEIKEMIGRLENKPNSGSKQFSKYLYWISGVAASLLLIISSYFFLKSPALEDTYDNPELAYQETKKVLLYVSSKLNKGTLPVEEKFSKMTSGTEEIRKISKLRKGLDEVQTISTKTEKLEALKYFSLVPEPENKEPGSSDNR
jgi:hypothetical protein